MKRKISKAIRAITPRPVWNAYLRARGLEAHQTHPWRTFIAFVMTATGVPEAEADSIPIFYESLSLGGILLSGVYRDDLPSVTPLRMPSGVAAYFKQ